MKPTMMEIRTAAERYLDEWEHVGIRTQEQPFEIGEMSHESATWIDGEPCGESLGGVCCTDVESPYAAWHAAGENAWCSHYAGEHVALIASDRAAATGDDEGEIILTEPVVVHIF